MTSMKTEVDGPMLSRAIELAARLHRDQVDKLGEPYILHPLRVMARVAGLETKMVAVLHDVVEDHPSGAFEALPDFPESVVEALVLLSRSSVDGEPEPYIEGFIDRIAKSGNVAAIRVKLADLEDNMDPARQPPNASEDERYQRRMTRYRLAHQLLDAALAKL